MIFFSTNIWLTIFGYLVVGLCAGGRVPIGTAYQNEFVQYKYQAMLIALIGVGDSSTMLFQAIYYWILPDWLYLHIFGIAAAFVILLLILTIPESPKYLYANQKYNETRQVLKIIAKHNKADIQDTEIDKIVFEYESTRLSMMEFDKDENAKDSTKVRLPTGYVPDQEIALEGKISEICQIWQLRRNFVAFMVILTSTSFCFFLINFELKKVPGNLVHLTIVS